MKNNKYFFEDKLRMILICFLSYKKLNESDFVEFSSSVMSSFNKQKTNLYSDKE